MAYSKLPDTPQDATKSLTECWICLSEMEQPKALPCLHSFCLKCLKKIKHPPGIFVCPLCKDKTTLPPDGVDGFKDNFLIKQLKDMKTISAKQKIRKPCVSCGAEYHEILARCMDCNGFLCQHCVNLHQTIKPLKGHTVFTIDELQSGQAEMGEVMKDENCQKHNDQVQRWFCKTCSIPICRDCTVMDHVRPDHDYTTIESANKDQVKKIKELMAGCSGLIHQLTNAISNTELVELNLAKSVDNVKKQLDEEKKTYLDAVENKYKEMMEKLSYIKADKFETIIAIKVDLTDKKIELTNAVLEAKQVITAGSKHDLASNYSNLCKTLGDLQHVKTTSVVNKEFGEIRFKPINKMEIRVNMGAIKGSNQKEHTLSFKGIH